MELTANTKAILLLTAPLLVGPRQPEAELLTLSEYNRLGRLLLDSGRQPADLLERDAFDLVRSCAALIREERLQRLLERGFLLGQAIERWSARAIWIISRADPSYPRRIKNRLREASPPVIYGCGDQSFLEAGGLAVVGSRNVDDLLIQYAKSIGRLAAQGGTTIISGAAKGIDQAAMRGALEIGGRVIGVMADTLERAVLNRDNRELLIGGKLALISPFDPSSGFNVGNAMQRNKLIYALADAALVVNTDVKKGGTWAGATEQLDKYRQIPVYTRSSGENTVGLAELQKRGALPWPNPNSSEELSATIKASMSSPKQEEFTFVSEHGTFIAETEASSTYGNNGQPAAPQQSGLNSPITPAMHLFNTVRELIIQVLAEPKNSDEIATEINVSKRQVMTWLEELVGEGLIEKRTRPVRYIVRKDSLF